MVIATDVLLKFSAQYQEFSMSTFPPALTSLMALQHGVISAEQLGAHGITARQRQTLVRTHALKKLHDGVYASTAVSLSLEARCVAACLAVTDLVISGPTAAQLLNLRKAIGNDIHGMVLHGPTRLAGVVVHRTNQLDVENDVDTRPDGIRLLRPPRLGFDLARFLDDDGFESVIEQMIERRLSNIPRFFATGRRLKKPGRDGSARFARVLAKRPAWAKPKDSDLEVALLRALGERGVALVPQCELLLPDGSSIHLDGGDPSRRFGVEVDHITWHGGRAATQYDKWRDRQTSRLGWVIPRVTDEDLDDHWVMTINDLVEIYNGRRAA